MSYEPKAEWFSMSTRFLRDKRIQKLILKHGNDVSSVAITLFGEARLQKKAGEADITYRDLAHDSFVSEETAKSILEDANDLGFLVIDEQDEIGVILHFPAWKRHQNTASQQRSREARKASTQADVIDSHQPSSNVVLHDITRQTEQDKEDAARKRAADSLCQLLADLITGNDPDGKVTTPTKTWHVDAERMLRLDGRDPERAANLIRWCQQDSFWLQNIKSMSKFRTQYATLQQAATEEYRKANRGRASTAPAPKPAPPEVVAELEDIPEAEVQMIAGMFRMGRIPITAESIRERYEAKQKRAGA